MQDGLYCLLVILTPARHAPESALRSLYRARRWACAIDAVELAALAFVAAASRKGSGASSGADSNISGVLEAEMAAAGCVAESEGGAAAGPRSAAANNTDDASGSGFFEVTSEAALPEDWADKVMAKVEALIADIPGNYRLSCSEDWPLLCLTLSSRPSRNYNYIATVLLHLLLHAQSSMMPENQAQSR